MLTNGFAGKVAIVTGGSRGIGRAVVLELARSGAKVAFTYISNQESAQEVVNETEKAGQRAVALQLDARDAEAVKKFVNEVLKLLGRIDFLINNAGIIRDKSLMLMADSDWKDVMDTNLNGTFNLTRNVAMHLFKQKSGSVVNVSSTSGLRGAAGQTNYSASKAAIIGFTKAFAKEMAPYGVRVNTVAPGFIKTDMVKAIPETKMKEFESSIPMKRLGKPEEVAKAVVFLLSDAASYITGQVLPIDGGLAI